MLTIWLLVFPCLSFMHISAAAPSFRVMQISRGILLRSEIGWDRFLRIVLDENLSCKFHINKLTFPGIWESYVNWSINLSVYPAAFYSAWSSNIFLAVLLHGYLFSNQIYRAFLMKRTELLYSFQIRLAVDLNSFYILAYAFFYICMTTLDASNCFPTSYFLRLTAHLRYILFVPILARWWHLQEYRTAFQL